MASTSEMRKFLITGATGNQGGAVVQALVASNTPNIEILAVTRNTASPAAQALTKLSPQIKLVKGDFSDCKAMFDNAGSVYGVYSVQVDQYGSAEKLAQGEIQGKAMIDAAVLAGVKVFVQASGDRGGPEKSEIDPTPVEQFALKYRVEKHLREKIAESGNKITYTILRPTSYFSNGGSDLHGMGFNTMWNCMNKPLQFIALEDLGYFGAKALLEAGSPEFKDKALSLAGDNLTFEQASAIFKQQRGKSMPKSPAVIGTLVKWTQPEVKSMFSWWETVGFNADIEECKKLHPGLMDFAAWLRQTDRYGK